MSSHRVLVIIMTMLCLWGSYSPIAQDWEWPIFQFFARFAPTKIADAKVAVLAIDDNNQSKVSWDRQIDSISKSLRAYTGKAVVWTPELSDLNSLDKQQLNDVVSRLRKADRKKFSQIIRSLDQRQTAIRAIKKIPRWQFAVPYRLGEGTPIEGIEALKVDTSLGDSALDRLMEWVHRVPQASFRLDSPVYPEFKKLGFYPSVGPGEIFVQEPLLVRIGEQLYPSGILQAIASVNGVPVSKIEYIAGEGVRIGGQLYKTDLGFNIIPQISEAKYKGSIVPVYSVGDLISGKIKSAELNEYDALIVGLINSEVAHKTYTGQLINYPVWMANAINMILQDKNFEIPLGTHLVQRAMFLIIALYFLFLPLRLRGYIGIAFSGFIAVLLINAAFFSLFLYSTWLKMTLPVLYLIFGHLIIVFHFKSTMAFKSLQLEAANAYRELALNEQTQGNLDKAFAYLRKCPMDKKLLECLYNLGIEFESRRQFRQAVSVYEYISRKNPNYRDIKERQARHQTVSSPSVLTRSNAPNTAATLVVDHPNVARPVLGRYQIEKIVGQGAMGTVYLGVDPKIGRTVAIKTLALSEEFEPKQLEDVRRRFFREAETAGRLNHPNIVTIYDVGEEHDLAYIAMDFITGEGLENFVQGESLLPIEEVFKIGADVAEALDYAHSQNVVHRDVKPANIIYDPKTRATKVTDFGIACLTDTSKTRTGTIMGSPSYMSPEQLEGTNIDGRSDLYSLGVTLYQLFTATLPFTAESMTSLAYKIVKDKPKGVRQVRSELPVCLSRVINKSLEKDPGNRYQNGAEFAKALRKCGDL